MTIREQIEKREQEILSPFACLSINSRGRDYDEPQCDIRPVFSGTGTGYCIARHSGV